MWSITSFMCVSALILLAILPSSHGLLRRCYQCRSRGDGGSCKDPFTFNVTQIEDATNNIRGVTAVPCASGWCGKVIEGSGSLRNDDYDMATQRMCVQRGPSDSEDRCAYTIYNYRKVFMCFCQGDLCNSATSMRFSSMVDGVAIMLLSSGFVIWHGLRYHF